MANYINNSELHDEIMKSKAQDKLTRRAVEMLQLIAENSIKRITYENPMDRDDCIAHAMFDVARYWRGYNPEKSNNVFAFYTTMVTRGYIKGWKSIHQPRYAGTISLDNVHNPDNDDGIFSI